MPTKSIAIIGNGNVGQAHYNGMLNHSSDYGPSNMKIITRDYFDSDIRNGYRDQKLRDFDSIILAVKPKDAINTLRLIEGGISKKSLIISPVSGLSMDIIIRMLKIPYSQVVKMTLNTNIEHGKGVIVYSTTDNRTSENIQRMYHPMCSGMFKRQPKDILPAVTAVGSECAFFMKAVLLESQENNDVPFIEFLKNMTMKSDFVKKYMVEAGAAYDKIFSFRQPLIYATTESTLETLKVSCNSRDDIARRIAGVATKGGCTEVKIGKFDSREKINRKFLRDAFGAVYLKSTTFPKTINDEFNQNYGKNGQFGFFKKER
jgi:hypothetical protein